MNENEPILNEKYDEFLNEMAEKEKIQITISDGFIDRETETRSIRYNDQAGKRKEFLNLVYFGDEKYLWGNNVVRDLAKIIVGEKEVDLPANMPLGLFDIHRIEKLARFVADFKTIGGVDVKYPIAIYHNKAIEIYLPIFDTHSKTKEKILEMILAWGIELYKKDLPAPIKKEKIDLKNELGRILEIGREEEKKALLEEKKSFERSISDYLKNVQRYKNDLAETEKYIAEYDKPTSIADKVNAQLELLKGNKGIRNIKIVGDRIYVFTNPIKITLAKYVYDMGTFEMVFELGKRNYEDKMRVFNEKRTNDGIYNHPHIRPEGTCCLGNIEEKMRKLLKNRQIAEAIVVMLAYLHSYHSEGAYVKMLDFMRQIGTTRKLIKGTGKPRRKKAGFKPRPAPQEDPDEDPDDEENNDD